MNRFFITWTLCAAASILFITAIPCPRAASAEPETNRARFIERFGDLPVTHIAVRGLNKTRPTVITDELSEFKNRPVSEFCEDTARQRIEKMRLFKEIAFAYGENGSGAEIIVTLAEKRSLLPVPMALLTTSGWTAGLFLYEANLMGENRKLYAGGYATNFGWTLGAGFIDPPRPSSRYTTAVFVNGGKTVYENATSTREVFQRFRSRFIDVQYGAGYELGKFTPALIGRYRQAAVDSGYEGSIDAPQSMRATGHGLRLRYKDQHHTLYFNRGFDAGLDYIHGFSLGRGRDYDQTAGRARWAVSPVADHSLSFSVQGGAGNMPDVFEERIGGRAGFRTLPPSRTAADIYGSAACEYEIPFIYFSWATATVMGFVEGGAYKKDSRPLEYFYGPGAGLRLYLKNVAFPAFGFDYAWNPGSGRLELSVALGFTG